MRPDERSTVSTRTATEADLQGIGRSLARAFDDDPVWRWLVPDDRRWVKDVPWVFRYAAKEQLRQQTVWTTPDLGATAIWAPPGHRPSALRQLLVVPRMATVFRARSLDGLRLETALLKGRPSEPHWYLGVLGTEPAHQGRGYGSAILRPVLDRCDAKGTGAYLESSKESNIPFYRRHGFEVIGELQVVPTAPMLWRMWRDPVDGGADTLESD